MRTTHPLLAAVVAAAFLPNQPLQAQTPPRVPTPLPAQADAKLAPTPDPHGVEQTFVVDAAIAGDVVLDLRVEATLTEDTTTAGIQLGNTFGRVDYGTAYLVTGATKTAIRATHADGVIRLVVPAASRVGAQVVVDPLISTRRPARWRERRGLGGRCC